MDKINPSEGSNLYPKLGWPVATTTVPRIPAAQWFPTVQMYGKEPSVGNVTLYDAPRFKTAEFMIPGAALHAVVELTTSWLLPVNC